MEPISPQDLNSLRRLHVAARWARYAADVVELYLPVRGRPWALAGTSQDEAYLPVSEVVRALYYVEQALSPAHGSPCRYDRILRNRPWLPMDSPACYPDVLAAARALVHCHDRILRHYGWEELVREPYFDNCLGLHFQAHCPWAARRFAEVKRAVGEWPGALPLDADVKIDVWQWPDAPPIDTDLLTCLRRAADTLAATTARYPGVPRHGERFRHSEDFASVHWDGTDYTFNGTQAACIKVLWKEWKNGTPDVLDATLQEAADTNRELALVFRGHPAWGTMIQSTRKGTHRLGPPQPS